jgi:HEAT repeat protein
VPAPPASVSLRALAWLLALLVTGLLAPESAAHGGGYFPPTIPKGKSKPAGAGQPAGTGAPSGASSAKGAATGAAAARGRNRSGSPPVTLGDDQPMVPDIWEQWWFDNQDRLLGLRERLDDPTRTPHTLPAAGTPDVPRPTRRATDAQVREQILPVLYELLAAEQETEVLDSTLVALGRCAPADEPGRALDAVRPFLSHRDRSVQTSAILALGIQGAAQAIPLLGALMADEAPGRRAVADDEVDSLARALAALSLGLCNHPAAVPRLAALLESTPDSERDLKACLITALGLTSNEASDEALGTLRDRLADRRLDAVLKAYVPLALARLDGGARSEAGPALLTALGDRDTDDVVRTSCAIALGELDSARADVLAALSKGVSGSNSRLRHSSLIALAEIAARETAPGEAAADFHEAVAELLGRELDKPTLEVDHPFVAVATGLYLRGAGRARHAWLGERLLAQHGRQSDDSVRSAFAIGLGLAGVREAGPALAEDAIGTGDSERRGYAAIALGLLDDHAVDAELLAACATGDTPPALRVQLGLSLALLGSTQAVPALVALLESDPSQEAAVSAARTLGQIGDVAALASLAAIARDTRLQPVTRGMACVALGLLGERTPLPWNSRLRATHNGDARVAAIEYVLDIL